MFYLPRRRVSTHRRVAFRNGHLTNIIGESKGRLTIRDDACSHGAAANKTQTCSRHALNATHLRAFPLSNRAKRPTSAQARAHRAASGGAFSSLLADRKMCTGTRSWRPKCVAQGAPQIWGGFSRRENDISKEVYLADSQQRGGSGDLTRRRR